MVTYCVKCKSKTETINPKYKMSKNQKPMVQCKCVKCSKMKSRFISAAEAKKGGFIFTVPAVLGAVGAISGLASGASAIATAVNKKKSDDKMLAETKRHHVTMEKKKSKTGEGLYLKSYKK